MRQRDNRFMDRNKVLSKNAPSHSQLRRQTKPFTQIENPHLPSIEAIAWQRRRSRTYGYSTCQPFNVTAKAKPPTTPEYRYPLIPAYH